MSPYGNYGQNPTPAAPTGNANTPTAWAAQNAAAQAGTSPGGFTQSVQANLNNPAYMSQLSGYLGGQAAPGVAAGELATAQAEAALGVVPGQIAEGAANLSSQAGYSLANALLGVEGIQSQEGLTAQQIAGAAQQQGIEQGQYGVGQEQRALEARQLQEQYPGQVRAQQGAAAAAGATNTIGNQQTQAQMAEQQGYQGTNLYLQQQLAQLAQASEQVGYGLTQDQLASARQQLELQAKGQGLSAQQTISQLQYGLGQLGISVTPEQAAAAAAQGQGTTAQAYGGALSAAGAISGTGPNVGNG